MMRLIPLLEETYVKTQWEGNHPQLGREHSREPHHVGTLISDFQPLKLKENKFLVLKPPSLWYFVMAAQDE